MLFQLHQARQQSELVDGSLGAFIAVVYLSTAGPPALPDFVTTIFDSYIDPPFIPGIPNSVPIVPVTQIWNQDGQVLSRTQLPLSLAMGLTIHNF